MYEGGIRVPFYVRWPGRLTAGRAVDLVAAHIDVVPTVLDLSGVALPAGVRLDGRSIRPLLEGECAVYYGQQVEHHVLVRKGEQVFVPADVPHAPCNESGTPCTWIVVHSSGSDQDGIVLLPHLDDLLR